MTSIRSVAPSRGLAWIQEGYDYFSAGALAWIGIAVILLLACALAAGFAFLGLLLQVVSPALMAGLMQACREIDNGGRITPSHLFAGFGPHSGNLLLLWLLLTVVQFVTMLLALAVVFLTGGGMDTLSGLMAGDPDTLLMATQTILLAILVWLALILPALMAVWFAPALIMFNGMGVKDAMVASLRGCLANIMPFLVYGLVGLVLSILATIPLMLGWLILTPVVIASIYTSWRDIYGQAEPDPAP